MQKIVGLIVLISFVFYGCATEPEKTLTKSAEPNVPFTLELGEKVQAGPSEMTFKSVVQDSRCPKGAQCIRAGDATILIHNKGLYGEGDLELSTPENTQKNKINYGGDGGIGYSIELIDLEPYPTIDGTGTIEYKARLKMTIDAE